MCYNIHMKILILYATYSSGTSTAAQAVSEILSKDNDVTLKEANTVGPDDLQGYDLIILASPSWEYVKDGERKDGYPHQYFVDFIEKMQDKKMEGQKFAVLGLGSTNYPKFCGAVVHLEKLVADLGGNLIIPSQKIDGFYFDQDTYTKQLQEWASKIDEILHQ